MTNPNHSAPDVGPLTPFDEALEEYVRVRISVAEQERTRYKTMDAAHCENLVTIYHQKVLEAHRRVIPAARITEAQAREAFQKWWAANDGTYVDAYLAGLRDAGLLIEDKP